MRSACRPAPPLGSDPAMVNATGSTPYYHWKVRLPVLAIPVAFVIVMVTLPMEAALPVTGNDTRILNALPAVCPAKKFLNDDVKSAFTVPPICFPLVSRNENDIAPAEYVLSAPVIAMSKKPSLCFEAEVESMMTFAPGIVSFVVGSPAMATAVVTVNVRVPSVVPV